MFRKLLVANRGEIAVRIVRTCRDLGIPTVAVYSDADRDSLHVRYADEARRLGPAPSAESYLNVDALLDAARETGADSVHPGYGFLAENAEFARRCQEAGLTFVGPPPDAVALMGDKAAARRVARAAGVPIVPGTEALSGDKEALREAKRIGFPLLVKAVSGGGGKGMRTVSSLSELEAALRQARSEATSSFGDGSVYLERYLERPRHIEFQILADDKGSVIHLLERECSIQRRHQKLIEECPSPRLDADLRRRMGDAALAIAHASAYRNAGTVEFLLDQEGNYYFLEMNARLQVEHPVTEMVLGLDLVELQLEIAAGQPLSLSQEEIRPRGWAIEFRITAEDPYRDFLRAPEESSSSGRREVQGFVRTAAWPRVWRCLPITIRSSPSSSSGVTTAPPVSLVPSARCANIGWKGSRRLFPSFAECSEIRSSVLVISTWAMSNGAGRTRRQLRGRLLLRSSGTGWHSLQPR